MAPHDGGNSVVIVFFRRRQQLRTYVGYVRLAAYCYVDAERRL